MLSLDDLPLSDRIDRLQQHIMDGNRHAFEAVPMLLKRVIQHREWEGRMDRFGKPFASFETFAEHPLWEGLEATIEDLLAFCRNDPEAQQLIKSEMGALTPNGGDRKSARAKENQFDNVKLIKGGNSATYLLKRLKRSAPELAERVVSGEMSARAAAIEARIIKKPTPLDELRRAWAKASPDERSAFRDWIDTYAVESVA